ncbi:hypothetical protein ACP70R_043160 [Stipagrostis hirtigluma subsp. patula]
MLALHPRLVASGGEAADDEEGDSRLFYFVVVACVSLLLFIVLAAAVSVARAGAIAGAVALVLGLVGWFAPTGAGSGVPATQQQRRALAAAAPGVRLVHHRCACGLTGAAIDALPAFAYAPPAAAKGGGGGEGGDDGVSGKPRGSAVLCAVCLEDVRAGEMVRQLPACAHLFHVDCVDAWLRAHRTCPLCRCELPPPKPTAKATAAAAMEPSADALPPV